MEYDLIKQTRDPLDDLLENSAAVQEFLSLDEDEFYIDTLELDS